MKNFYEVLGVPRNATQAQIKAARRKLARDHHPDREKENGDAERMAEVNAAYEVLGDEDRRKRYDETGNVNNPEDRARGFFMQAVAQVISEDGNLITNVNNVVVDAIKRCETDVKKAKKVIDKFQRRLPCITAPKGNRLIIDMLEGKIAEGQKAVASATSLIETMKEALKLLDGYSSTEQEAPKKEDSNFVAMLDEVFQQRRGR